MSDKQSVDAALHRTWVHERAGLMARIESEHTAQVELFALLAENAAQVLPPAWAVVVDLIAAEERFWVYPSVTVGALEDGTAESCVPYLNRLRLRKEWQDLTAHASHVMACQESGRRRSLPA